MKAIVSFLFVILFGTVNAQVLVPEKSLRNVFYIHTDSLAGSAMLINIDGKDYLLTARHLFKRHNKSGDTVMVRLENATGFRPKQGRFLAHNNQEIDIVAIDLGTNLVKQNGYDFIAFSNESEVFLSQECFFLGFPLGIGKIEDYTRKMNDGFPIPFVKKGIISGFTGRQDFNVLFLDAHNNQGFSGGPVITIDTSGRVQLVAVIGGYLHDKYPDDMPQELNSGIAFAFSIKHLEEIINSDF